MCECAHCSYVAIAQCLSKRLECDVRENPFTVSKRDPFSTIHSLGISDNKLLELVVTKRYTTLALALYYGCGLVMLERILSSKFCKVDGACNSDKDTPLIVGIKSGECSTGVFARLLKDPRINTKSMNKRSSPLLEAFSHRPPLPVPKLRLLLADPRLSPRVKGFDGMTLFITALKTHSRNLEFVRFILKQNRIFSSIRDVYWNSPLMAVTKSACTLEVFNEVANDKRINCKFTCGDITRWVFSTGGIMPDVKCAILLNLDRFARKGIQFTPVHDFLYSELHDKHVDADLIKVILDSTPANFAFGRCLSYAFHGDCSVDVFAVLIANDKIHCGYSINGKSMFMTAVEANRFDVAALFLQSERMKNEIRGLDVACVSPQMLNLLSQCKTLDTSGSTNAHLIGFLQVNRAVSTCALLLRMSRILAEQRFAPGGNGAVHTAQRWERRVKHKECL